MSDITVCIPTLNRYDLLEKCIDTLFRGSEKPKEVVIIDNGIGGEIRSVPDIRVERFGHNLGVAPSWNWFIKNVELPILICNDDIEFGRKDLETFQTYYNSGQADFYYPENINHLNVFSCFMPTKNCIEKVGLFDINCKRAYFEDNDYFYRLLLAGMKIQAVPTNLTHFVSGTLKALTQEEEKEHHRLFRENKAYYEKKWGGPPHQEKFRSPFNK